MDPEQLYRNLAEGIFIPSAFPGYSEREFHSLRRAIQQYIDLIPKGCLATLFGLLTGANQKMATQAGEMARIAKLDLDDIQQSIAAVSFISIANSTPSEIHAVLEKGALKGFDQILQKGGNVANPRVLNAISFVVLYAAMLWNYKHGKVIETRLLG